MKLRVHLKCPDALYYAITGEAENDEEIKRLEGIASRWFMYGESVTLVIDTELQTCEVEEVRQ